MNTSIDALITELENVNSQLQVEGKFVKLNRDEGKFVEHHSKEESIIVAQRKPVIEGMLEHFKKLKQLEREPTSAELNVMIAAETGFGKTYDMAMWSHVLAKVGSHHLIAVPNDQLVGQAKKMISEVFDINIQTPNTVQELENMLKNATDPVTIIVTHDLLLQQENDRKFEDQTGEKPNMWISIDEADKIGGKADNIDQETAFKSICKLGEVYPTTYLTGTPNRRTFYRCGKVIAPERSNRRCITSTIKTVNVIAKTNKKEKFTTALAIYTVFTLVPTLILTPIVMEYVAMGFAAAGIASNFWLYSMLINSLQMAVSLSIITIIVSPITWIISKAIDVEPKDFFLRVIANISNLVKNEKSSPAHEHIEECEEAFNYKKVVETSDLLTSVRWNIQSPIGENALILADEDEVDNIVNLSFALHGEDNKVYENGKIYTRYEVYNKIQPEGKSYKEYRVALRESNFINCVKKQYSNLTDEQISELTQKVDFSGTAEYLKKYRVMYSMIDLTLSYLMKYDNIALDKGRQKDLNQLVKNVRDKVNDASKNDNDASKNDNDIVSFLKKKGFSEQFARNELLPQIKVVISGLEKSNDENRKLIVDNWHLSKDLHNLMEKDGVLHGLSNFCEKNKCVFAGLGKNNLGIKENEPFFKITHNKSNKHGDEYSAEYCDYSKEDIDNLAKYALTTIIDGSKGRGVDSEYNHVASIFTDSCSQFNNPSEALQNLGRNREKNPNRQSWFFAAAGEKTELFIDEVLAKLNSDPGEFCKNILFPANDRYNELIKGRMGVELGRAIEDYISQNVDALGKIDEMALKNFSEDLIKKTHKKLKDINDFNAEETKKDLDTVLKSTAEYLRSYENRIKNNGKLSLGNRALFFTAGVVLKAFYYIWFAFDYIIFVAKSLTLNEKADGQKVLTYDYVVKNYNIENALRSEKIFDKAIETAKSIYQNFEKESHDNSKLTECMGKIASLFHNEVYKNALNKLLSPFLQKKGNKKHLLTILNVIYPNEDNESKLDQITDFNEDLKSPKLETIVNKYCQGDTYNNTDLCKIVGWIKDINEEVIKCQAYCHNVNNLIKIGEPKLKTNHHIFNVRAVYSIQMFLKNSYTHPVFMLFAALIYAARYFILVTLIPGLLCFIMPEIIPNLLSWPLAALCHVRPEKFREFLFSDNITNDSRSEINKLDLISKQPEAEHMNRAADGIISNLNSIDVQQQLPMQLQPS